MLIELFFWWLATVLIGSALGVITSRNPVFSALFLVLAFVTSAFLWMLLEAEFLAIVLVLVYVGAVMATVLFGDRFEDWFGTIGASLYSLFQIMTLESWSMGIVRPVMEQFPLAWMFFVPFILCTSFAVLNLFIAIIVSAMDDVQRTEHAGETSNDDIVEELRALRQEVADLRKKR